MIRYYTCRKLQKLRDRNELTMSEDLRLSETCVNSSGKITQGNLSRQGTLIE
jgi:hypothetical protein